MIFFFPSLLCLVLLQSFSILFIPQTTNRKGNDEGWKGHDISTDTTDEECFTSDNGPIRFFLCLEKVLYQSPLNNLYSLRLQKGTKVKIGSDSEKGKTLFKKRTSSKDTA